MDATISAVLLGFSPDSGLLRNMNPKDNIRIERKVKYKIRTIIGSKIR